MPGSGTLTLADDETERLIYIGLRCVGAIRSQASGGWVAYDEYEEPIGIFQDADKAGGAVLAAHRDRLNAEGS